MKARTTNFFGKQVMVEGLMTFGKLETGLHTLDFACCEDVEAEPFEGIFHVQCMRDGNVYMQVKQQHSKRANSTLLRKVAHGRLSATRDEAYQLTLKVFKRESLDVKETMLREAIELINNVKL